MSERQATQKRLRKRKRTKSSGRWAVSSCLDTYHPPRKEIFTPEKKQTNGRLRHDHNINVIT